MELVIRIREVNKVDPDTISRLKQIITRTLGVPRTWWMYKPGGSSFRHSPYRRQYPYHTGEYLVSGNIKVKDLEYLQGYLGLNGVAYSMYLSAVTPYGKVPRIIKPETYFGRLRADINWIKVTCES